MLALISGPQLRAARAMAGLDRQQLAEASGVAPQTIARLEAMERIRATVTTLSKLQDALEAAGIEFIDNDRPGVRSKKVLPAPTAA
jgi:transcriptional regulator with XRE-family HTH domain